MKIAGCRHDGALYLTLGGGLAVILKDKRVTPTLDESVVETMGPWTPADNSFSVRREVALALDLARVANLDYFDLGGPGSGNFGHGGRPGEVGGSGGEAKGDAMSPERQKQHDALVDYRKANRREVVTAERADAPKEWKGTPKGPWKNWPTDKEIAEGEQRAREVLAKQRPWQPGDEELDENEIAAEQAGKYWKSPEGQAAKAKMGTRTVRRPGDFVEPGHGRVTSRPEDLSKNPAPFSPAPGEKYKPTTGPEAEARTAQLLEQARTESRAQNAKDKAFIEKHHGTKKLEDDTVADPDQKPKKEEILNLPPTRLDNAAKFRELLAMTVSAKRFTLADAGEHPFTYCKEHVIPAMEKDGKAPDDPDAFCAWWKAEKA